MSYSYDFVDTGMSAIVDNEEDAVVGVLHSFKQLVRRLEGLRS